MTVKELLQRDPHPDTLVGIYKQSDQGDHPALIEQFLGSRAEVLESRYAEVEAVDWTDAYHMRLRRVGIVVYIKEKEDRS